jgi:lysophospholipase L1-like esterase
MRPILRLCLAATVLLLCTSANPAPKQHTVLAATPISRMDTPWWRARHEAKLAELRKRQVDLVFLGDSIFQAWEMHGPPDWLDFAPVWQRFYGDRNAINLGFTGDATAHLLWRIENGEVAGIAPKVAVILVGANNLGRLHWSAEDTVTGVDAVIAQLRRRLPRTKLLLLGILPSDRTAWATETTLKINQALALKYQNGGDVTYLDVGRVFMKDGRLNRHLYTETKMIPPGAPLHPSVEGLELVAEAIEPTLAALLGDRARIAGR